MRFLHTSDWHIGKGLKGHSRLDEQRDVLREIVQIARDREVDAVLIPGDLYDSVAPTAEAQQLVVQALVALRETGAEVIAMAGNHDHALTFDAYRPLMGYAGIVLTGRARTPVDGGVVEFTARSTGERARVAVLPFLSQRYAIRAAELVANTPAENAGSYDQLIRDMLAVLTAGFQDDAVNIVMAHLTVTGAAFGGGERMAQSIFEYHVPASAFPAGAHYVALGHLHRRQSLPAPCPVHYCGSPICVDFGEQDNNPSVLVVDATPTTPASVTDVAITTGRRLRTVRGTVGELADLAESVGDDFLRVYVREPSRAGMRDEIQALLPNALDVFIDPEFATKVTGSRPSVGAGGAQRTAGELFHEFCVTRAIDDPRVEQLFARLHDRIDTVEA
jgi:exonuclease SbcD